MLTLEKNNGTCIIDPDSVTAVEDAAKDETTIHLAGGTSVTVKGDAAAIAAKVWPKSAKK